MEYELVQDAGEPIDTKLAVKDEKAFEKAIRHLLPDADMAGAERWIAFAKENVSHEQYIDFEPAELPVDKQLEAERWLGSLLAGLYQVKQAHGKEMAEKVWECGVYHSCLYPNEMLPMARHLQKGGVLEDVDALIDKGTLEESTFFIKLQDVLPPDSPYWEADPFAAEQRQQLRATGAPMPRVGMADIVGCLVDAVNDTPAGASTVPAGSAAEQEDGGPKLTM